jgi:hypothetical protein
VAGLMRVPRGGARHFSAWPFPRKPAQRSVARWVSREEGLRMH